MIVVLRCFGGNTVLTVARVILGFCIPGRKERKRGGLLWKLKIFKLMNELSLPDSSEPGKVVALPHV